MQLAHEQRRQMVAQAKAAIPREACGLLVGTGSTVTQIMPISNRAPDAQHFQMDEIELLRALKQIDAANLELIGIYHSHPNSPPLPSGEDIQQALLQTPNLVHVIIGLKGVEPQVQAWSIGPAGVEPIAFTDDPLTRTQQGAIAVAILAGLVALLVVALVLLPPAPTLPISG